MAENAFQSKTDAALLSIGQQAYSVINASGGAYGTSPEQETALTNANTAMSGAIAAKQAARDASKGATQQALAARGLLLDALSSIGGTVYNDPSVTDQMLADAGYAVHDPLPTKHYPVQPSKLQASPDSSGTVLLTWDPETNIYGTTFVVEGRASESDPWTYVTTTTRKRISVTGFSPGETYWFRVSASHNGQNSIPCAPAAIWGPEQVVPLQVAA